MSWSLADFWHSIQGSLFPRLSECLPDVLTEDQRRFVCTLELVRIENYVRSPHGQLMGRPEDDRRCLGRAFVLKAVYNLPTTELLIEFVRTQSNLRRLCGWERLAQVPSAATFSRAFADFAETYLLDHIHACMVKKYIGDDIVMHVSRDSTEVPAREHAGKKQKRMKEKKRRGRPRIGEVRPAAEPKRLDVQMEQSWEAALSELPKTCDYGTKLDTSGHKHTWKGYKAHIDWADGNIPINVVTTSASVHDSQAAIPMARRTAERVVSLYDLMDSAYDAPQIRKASEQLGHVAIIDPNPRRGGVSVEKIFDPATAKRYKERTTAERGNARLKDEFGIRHLRVRGHAKAHLHIMFGVIALFADQILKPWSN